MTTGQTPANVHHGTPSAVRPVRLRSWHSLTAGFERLKNIALAYLPLVPGFRRVRTREMRNGNGHGGADGAILNLPSAVLQREREAVAAARLTPEIEAWFQQYSRVGRRARYAWQWCVHGAELTTLPCVLSRLRPHLCDTKVLSIMLCVLLDDVADEGDRREFLESLLQIVERQTCPDLDRFSPREREYAEVARRLSVEYERRIREYPCYHVFEDLLRYDLMQYFNTMRFSHLLNRHLTLLNSAEHDLYLPHAMHMMSFATLDLMCIPDFPLSELGRFREAMWYAQCMGRIGNLLSTWRREIEQGDFTSGVFARAVLNRDLTVEQLVAGDPTEIEAAIERGRHEEYFYRRWQFYRSHFHDRIAQIGSVDLSAVLDAHDRFFHMHLACRGQI